MSYWSLWPEEYGSQVPQPRSHSLSHSKSNVLSPKVLTRALRLKRGRNQVPTARGGGLPDKSTDGCPLRGGQGSKSGLLPIWPTDHLDSVVQSSLFPKQQILQGRGVGGDGLWVSCGSAGPWLTLCQQKNPLQDVCYRLQTWDLGKMPTEHLLTTLAESQPFWHQNLPSCSAGVGCLTRRS